MRASAPTASDRSPYTSFHTNAQSCFLFQLAFQFGHSATASCILCPVDVHCATAGAATMLLKAGAAMQVLQEKALTGQVPRVMYTVPTGHNPTGQDSLHLHQAQQLSLATTRQL